MGREPRSASDKREEGQYLRRLGNHLRELREAKNLTPQDLAETLGVTPQYIYMIESGKAKPSERRLNELASALGDLAPEFLSTAVERVEEEFAARLREAGLGPQEIDEAARRVSARVKSNVVLRQEPLRIRESINEADLAAALEAGEEVVTIRSARLRPAPPHSAKAYASSVKDQFDGIQPRTEILGASFGEGQPSNEIPAGPHARITVNIPLSPNQKELLQGLASVIENILSK